MYVNNGALLIILKPHFSLKDVNWNTGAVFSVDSSGRGEGGLK